MSEQPTFRKSRIAQTPTPMKSEQKIVAYELIKELPNIRKGAVFVRSTLGGWICHDGYGYVFAIRDSLNPDFFKPIYDS